MKKSLNSCFFAVFALVSFALMTTSLAGCNHSSEAGDGQKSETQYTISFELNGGQWVSGYTATTKYKASNGATLPASSVITKSGYTFAGWYGNADFSGAAVTSIARGTKGNKSFWAKWEIIASGTINVTQGNITETLGDLNDNDTEHPYVLAVSSADDLSAIMEALQDSGNSGKYVSISLESSEDLTEISSDAFAGCTNITSITIPSGVETIGEGAFEGCTNLTEINLPDSVTTIAESAFEGCSNLSEITIPDGVEEIGTCAFKDTNITSITIPGSVETVGINVFQGCNNLRNITFGDDVQQTLVKNVLNNLTVTNTKNTPYSMTLSNGNDLSEVTKALTSSKKYIDLSLENCEELKTINNNTFKQSWYLTEVTLPSSVDSISADAFKDCTSLQNINIAEDNPYYASENGFLCDKGKMTLIKCPQEKSDITIPSNISYIGENAFKNCASFTTIDIPNTVVAIGNNAFTECGQLTELTLPDSITSIENEVFSGCFNLKEIKLPINLTSIGYGTFNNCINLASIEIPNKVTEIGEGAFYTCTSLKTIEIPSNVKTIRERAFSDCMGLSSIKLNDGIETIEREAFAYCLNLKSITIPGSVKIINPHLFMFTYIENITLEYGVTTISELAFEGNSSLKNIEIPSSVTSIGNEAFRDCSNLKNIEIPNSVTSMGGAIFESCSSLETITLGSGLKTITSDTFRNCTSLEDISIPSSITKIEDNAFNGCTKLENIILPESVTSIEITAFRGCTNLESITIPNSVTYIGLGAFSGCTALETITFTGTTAQWNAIPKGDGWNYDCPSNMQIICTGDTSE